MCIFVVEINKFLGGFLHSSILATEVVTDDCKKYFAKDNPSSFT